MSQAEAEWQRLDPRMLLVHPVRELVKFLPAVIGLVIAGTSGGLDLRFQLLALAVPLGLGVAKYLTTSYRVGPERVELRHGVVSRHQLSTRRDRVRTVDLTATLVHRALGLQTVRIGTGTGATDDESELELDALPTEQARALRRLLLAATEADGADVEEDEAGHPVLELDPRWARYAPLTGIGFALTGAALGVGGQVLQQLDLDVPTVDVDDARHLLWLVPAVAAAFLLAVVVVAVAGYLVTNWAFTLTRGGRDGSWHLSRGLLTTRETTIDDERIGGVVLGEPLGLRLAGAARLTAIVTGLDRKEQQTSVLAPPAPRPVVERVGGAVLGTSTPLAGPLRDHGPRARTRRWVRALVPATALLLTTVAVAAASGAWWVVAVGAAAVAVASGLAADRSRSLGHALADGHVVARSGSLLRQREALAAEAVIGWTFRATWLQRRAGLTTLVATTAGGRQRVSVLDVPETDAVALAEAAVPGLVGAFRAPAPTTE